MKSSFRPRMVRMFFELRCNPFSAPNAGSPRTRASLFTNSNQNLSRIFALVPGVLCLSGGLYAQAVAVAQAEGTVTDPTAKFIFYRFV